MSVAVVTGSNSGIGRATAVALAAAGHTVAATMRDPAKAGKLRSAAEAAGVADRIHVVGLDVGDDASVRDGMAAIAAAHGPVSVLVNNAGIAPIGVLEETPVEVYADAMNVNVYGAIRCTQAVLAGMRSAGAGVIVNVSSVVGRFASLAQSPYVASKWALEGLSEGLAQEVAPFGVRVVIVEPGVTRSAIFAKNTDAPNRTGAYDAPNRRMFQFYAVGIPQATPAEEVGAAIAAAVADPQAPLRLTVAWGGPEIVAGRAAMSDADWVAMGHLADDEAYYASFEDAFGLDLRPR
jgi:NAD(P)-dependent dehydrogenase (short-subunit alcohol dehydrogenase family)